ncbi:unnamed protein product [Rotaria socialis]|uniref:Uncharacterized protein n=1 Tax=Rotaria socialis TaxID=392032 RepID=A0A820UD74_9BILA|nr:unnamed protein product [Rotaria socialis]CAF3421358.1 unnamed protein product [Rotaria socialis]CAF3434693.1 unnamed protein product [Rotaria socialis]CAF3539298.1 unnamed protein product [Rotaria socialis]CAF3557388.1 unnamed protein product [Rotaria socialis]
MRYPCAGFPLCLKTFENGHVLSAHHLSCEHALKKLNDRNQHQEQIQSIQRNYLNNRTKGNKVQQTFTGLDYTQKFLVRDRYQLGGNNNPQESYRRIRQPPDPRMVIIQTKSQSIDFSGYYT